jgi:SNF2 family DNA or RNA helicase
MLKREQLHDYQVESCNLIKSKKRIALWLPMGFGKSVTTATAIVDLLDSFSIQKTLIIAPLRVANSVWHEEFSNWEHLQHLTYSICTGSLKEREQALNKDCDVYIINRENVKWLIEYLLKIKNKMFDMVVVDESDSFKSSSSQRFKALKKLSTKVEYFVELTGTPSPNGYLDIWSQMYLIDGGERLGKTMTAFKQRFFESDWMGYTWTIRDGSETKIKSLIKDITYSAEPVIETKRIDIIRDAELPKKLAKQYADLEKNFFVELENCEVEALSAASLSNSLTQFSNGAIYNDESYDVIHDIKIEMLKEVLEPLNESVLVAYQFKSDYERLVKAFPHARKLDKDPKTIKDWNARKIPLLLAQSASASHGINAQHGGSIIVWFGMTFNLGVYQQFVARLDRQGQKETVRNIHLVIKNTIDEKILNAIEAKATTQQELIDYIKEHSK